MWRLLDQGLRVDLLLTDVVLPNGMTGIAAAGQVRARYPGLKVLYMSGYSGHVVVHDGVVDSDIRLLTKPFRKAELANAIRHLIDTTD
jgi:CheY-like chemotaxis protein